MKTRINLIIAIFLMCIVHLNTGWNETVERNIQDKVQLNKTNQRTVRVGIQSEKKGVAGRQSCAGNNTALTTNGKEIWGCNEFNMYFLALCNPISN